MYLSKIVDVQLTDLCFIVYRKEILQVSKFDKVKP